MKQSAFILFTLLAILLLCTPFAIDHELANKFVSSRLDWIRIISLLLCISVLPLLFSTGIRTFRFSLADIFVVGMAGMVLLSYSWYLNPEPEKLMFGGLWVVLWFIFRYVLSLYPNLKSVLIVFFIGTALVEALWGMAQLHGWRLSNHSLFLLTGSFFNPGPYSGYLAIALPVSLGILLKQPKRNLLYYFSALIIFTIVITLPSGMSRSAWIAAAVSSLWVYVRCCPDKARLKSIWDSHRKLFVLAGLGCVLLLGALYSLKKDSADGRFLMWKITANAILKQPVAGTGLGGFPAAYAEAQARYMASGKATEQEKWVAGCPEYAFNEYLQIGLEQGLVGLILFIGWLGLLLRNGVRAKQYACCGGIISFMLFAFSSYPLQLPDFWVLLLLLGVVCVTPDHDGLQPSSYPECKRLFLAGTIALGISLFWMQRDYHEAYRKWGKVQLLYNNKAYGTALEEYVSLYPLLKHKPEFLFEASQCLSKTGQYEEANEYLRRAVLLSADPMLYYVMAKNEQLLGAFSLAEEHLLYAIQIVPERIYPYYLLAHLYADLNYNQPEKMRMAIDSVLLKSPKIESPAIKEMRKKVKLLLDNTIDKI